MDSKTRITDLLERHSKLSVIATTNPDAEACIQASLAARNVVLEIMKLEQLECIAMSRVLVTKAFDKLRSGERSTEEVEAAMIAMLDQFQG